MTPSPSAKKRNAYYRGPEPMTAALQSPTPPCPKCAGPVWDQKGSKFWGTGLFKSGKQKPRWECKNKECGGAVWEKDAKPVSQGHPEFLANQEAEDAAELAGKIGPPDKPKLTAIYLDATKFVLEKIVPLYEEREIGASAEAVGSMVATLFIAASKER